MKSMRLLSLGVCLSLILGLLPVRVIADAVSDESVLKTRTDTHTIGELGGYLSGNINTTTKLFAERRFTEPGGTGFAAEQANNLIDRLKGHHATVIGGDNVKDGADRKIINRNNTIWIQDKYYSSASESVKAAFNDETGIYRYMDSDGKPMLLEVPRDQYDDAVKLMRSKIEAGQVPGVTDPDDAKKIIKKGSLKYVQAKNIAKAGTIDSLAYDSLNGTITSTCAAGITFALDYACCRLNGLNSDASLKNAGMNGLKTGGVVFATYVISSQLAKTGASNALIPASTAIAKSLGKDVCEEIVKQAGLHATGAKAIEQTAKIISKELIADGVLIIVLTGADTIELFRGRISKEELLKNLTVTIVTVAAGTAGGFGGAALGTLIAPGAGTTIGGIIGSGLAGGAAAYVAETLIAPYYESDAEEMYDIISKEFTVLCEDYIVDEEEGSRITDALRNELAGDVLKDMYASEDRNEFALELMEPLFVEEINHRPQIVIPSEEMLRAEMKSTLQGVVFIH